MGNNIEVKVERENNKVQNNKVQKVMRKGKGIITFR